MFLALKDQGSRAFSAISMSSGIIICVDMVVALFLMWNFNLMLKLPLFGPMLRKLESTGAEVLKKRPWIRRMAFIGVALFVIVPFQGSGGAGGTIMGIMIGMKKEKVFYAVTLGAVLGCYMMAIIGYYIGSSIVKVAVDISREPYFIPLVGLILIVVAAVVVFAVYKKRTSKEGGVSDESGDESEDENENENKAGDRSEEGIETAGE